MTEDLHFVADAALIERLGRELVTKQETALIELVKKWIRCGCHRSCRNR